MICINKIYVCLCFVEGGEHGLADSDLFSDTSSATGESMISSQSSRYSASSNRSSLYSRATGYHTLLYMYMFLSSVVYAHF